MADCHHKDSRLIFQASIDDLDFLSLIETIMKHHKRIDDFIGYLLYEKAQLDLTFQALRRELGPEIRMLQEKALSKKTP